MDIKFVGGSGKNRSTAVDGQDTINYYLETMPVSVDGVQAKAPVCLLPTPGLTSFNEDIDLSGVVRCLYTTSTGRMFSVTGNQLVEYNRYGQKTIRGILKTFENTVSMDDCGNGSSRGFGLCIVDGQYGYNFNLTNNTFEQITDVSFPRAGTVIFYNGYFVMSGPNWQ